MLIDKVSVNVGEETTIHVEIYSPDITSDQLKYGDVRYIDGKMEVWYGSDNKDMSGWQSPPWGVVGYAAGIVTYINSSRQNMERCVYRILNSDPYFDEAAYTATLVGGSNE